MAEGKPFIKCGQLFDHIDAFDYTPETEQLFADAMNEALRWHAYHCPDYKAFLAENGLADLRQKYQPEQIPPLLTTIFEEFKLASVPEKQVKIELTSFDIDGRKSVTILDARSYKRILKVVENIFASLNLVDHKQKVNYVCFTPDPKFAPDAGSTFSNKLLTDLTAHRSVYYAIKFDKNSGDFKFDADDAAKKLIDFSTHPEPVRILGFPDCLIKTCDWLEKHNINLDLGKKSLVVADDVWKIQKGLDMTMDSFKDRVNKLLGIPKENIRNLFGLAEYGIPYITCECGRLHVPIYSRAMCVDPETLFPVDDGEEGLLYLMTPYISSYPAISVLTTYKAIIEDNCSCGRLGKTFRIIGRAGLQEHKDCAAGALELLK